MSKKEKATREYLQTLSKEQVINLCLQFMFDVEVTEQQLAEKDKEIEDLKEWKEWYSIWHENFKKQIKDLTTELETYRPTKLHGNGQCKCFNCNAINWTDWCSQYKGHIYCNKCLKDILKEEQTPQTQLAIQELEKVKMQLKDKTKMMSNEEHCYQQRVVSWIDVCDQINQQIKELSGGRDGKF